MEREHVGGWIGIRHCPLQRKVHVEVLQCRERVAGDVSPAGLEGASVRRAARVAPQV
jgi:hypothetical protein